VFSFALHSMIDRLARKQNDTEEHEMCTDDLRDI